MLTERADRESRSEISIIIHYDNIYRDTVPPDKRTKTEEIKISPVIKLLRSSD